jgi:hypothetical protein
MPLQFIQIHLEICQLNILISGIPLGFCLTDLTGTVPVLERLVRLELNTKGEFFSVPVSGFYPKEDPGIPEQNITIECIY